VGGAACKTDAQYFMLMQRKDRKPKVRPSGDKWFVYIMRCADGSLYTGITKDVKRRCQQHNAGTASRYTRSRRPVKLVYQEVNPSQSSALKREAAIKALSRRDTLALIRLKKKAR
jgi:predicted GIY-YIG superfamily endonuclease